MPVWTWILMLALILAGIWTMLRKPTREWRRRRAYRRGIRRNEPFWSELPVRSPHPPRLRIIASLTTTPSRLALIEPVLRSLSAGQTRPPDEIHLNIPRRLARTGEEYVIPDFLEKYPVRIHRTEDFGPATKLVPTLERVTDPNTWILAVDDDVRYLPAALERLEDAAVADPDSAHGYADYALWRKWRSGEPVDILAGYAGYVVRRGFFGHDFRGYFEAAISNQACFFQDDVVVSNYLALRGVRRWRISAPDCNLELLKKRGCLLEHAGDGDSLSLGAGSGMQTRARSVAAHSFLQSIGYAGPRAEA